MKYFSYLCRQEAADQMKSNIITGQFVQIDQTPASLWARIGARLIDQIVIALYLYAVVWLVGKAEWEFEEWLEWALLILVLMPFFFYTPAMEMMNNGQTLGKMAAGIRVVMADGTTPTLGALLLRWVLMPFDLYLTGGVGVLCIAFTRNHQRLGDLAAGTMVISKNNYSRMLVGLSEFSHVSRNYRPRYPEAARLTQGQASVIERVVDDCNIHNNYDERRVTALSEKVQQTLDVKSREKSHLAFLMVLLKDYQYFLLEIV